MSILYLKDPNTGKWLSIDSLQGQSAYDVAVEQGFKGTEQEWLASLIGSEGPAGPQGEPGPAGPMGQDGKPGLSAYEVAVKNGFSGTEEEWLESLKAIAEMENFATKEYVNEIILGSAW